MLIESKTKVARGVSVETRSCLKVASLFQSIMDVRAILCAAVAATLIIANVMPAIAEVEDASDEPDFVYKYIGSSFSIDFIISLFASDDSGTLFNPTKITEYDQNNRDSTARGHVESDVSENLNSFLGARIPDAVWSLDASTGAHLDHISSDFGSELETTREAAQEGTDLWTRARLSFALEDNNSSNYHSIPDVLPIAIPDNLPIAMQVASCGGSSAEHIDLDYCDIVSNSTKQPGTNPSSSNTAAIVTTQDISSSISSSTTSTSGQETQVLAIPPTILNNVTSGDVVDLSDLGDPCVDTSSSCAITPTALIDSLTGPTDPLSAPSDPLAVPLDPPIAPTYPPVPAVSPTSIIPPTPVIPVGDLGAIPGPLITSTPPLVASPVPETSTWIMMIIGFGLAIVVCRRRTTSNVKRGTVWPFQRSPNGQGRC